MEETQLTIQIVIMDERGFINEYRDFDPHEKLSIDLYIWAHLKTDASKKIEIRKWKKNN